MLKACSWSDVFVLDNGAGSIKANFASVKSARLFPNAIVKARHERKRVFIADQLNECKDLSALFYTLPFQRGILVNWDVQRQIWDHIFNKDVCNVNHEETCLIFTEPFFNFTSVREQLDEIFFEEYQFDAVLRINPATLSAFHHYQEISQNTQSSTDMCCLVVDSGYSNTHVVPYCKGVPILECAVRIDVGGKALTNCLKEVISYRQLQVLDETYVINQCKEDSCFVSTNFDEDMRIAKLRGAANTILRDYVLPDFQTVTRGYLRLPKCEKSTSEEQVIRLANERFAVPEILFHPSDVGVNQMGISEAVLHVIHSCPQAFHASLFNNVVLTGGNCSLPGFKERIYNDIRKATSDIVNVSIFASKTPATYAWEGGVSFSKSPFFPKAVVTGKEYEEHGHALCQKRFYNIVS